MIDIIKGGVKVTNNDYSPVYHSKLIDMIKNSDWVEKEKVHRINKLNEEFNKIQLDGKITSRYNSLAHEIKSYEFLKKFGKPEIALDSKHTKGPDIKLRNYRIECVSCSAGAVKDEFEKDHLNENKKFTVYDYTQKLRFLLPRLTNSLKAKSDIFKKYIDDRNHRRK